MERKKFRRSEDSVEFYKYRDRFNSSTQLVCYRERSIPPLIWNSFSSFAAFLSLSLNLFTSCLSLSLLPGAETISVQEPRKAVLDLPAKTAEWIPIAFCFTPGGSRSHSLRDINNDGEKLYDFVITIIYVCTFNIVNIMELMMYVLPHRSRSSRRCRTWWQSASLEHSCARL